MGPIMMPGMNINEYKHVWEHEKNKLIPFVRNTKLNGNRLQVIPFLICFNPTPSKGKSKEICQL